MSMCGLEGVSAARLLQHRFARLPNDPEISRVDLFREMVAVSRQNASSPATRSPAIDTDFPCDPAFEVLAWDIRAAIFLIAMLDFDLTETALILQRNVHALADRIDRALNELKW
jgi:hypothetical protein